MRTVLAALVALMINVTAFCVAAIIVFSVPPLYAHAWFWLPMLMALSFLIAPFIAWVVASLNWPPRHFPPDRNRTETIRVQTAPTISSRCRVDKAA
jgi:hypothetical protein